MCCLLNTSLLYLCTTVVLLEKSNTHLLFLLFLQSETPQTDPWNEPWCESLPPGVPAHWCACWLDTMHLGKIHIFNKTALFMMITFNPEAQMFCVLGAYPVARPAGDCRCPPSRGWRYHIQTWGAARTAGQSAASHRCPRGSGTHRTRKEAHVRSRKTGPGSAPGRMSGMSENKQNHQVKASVFEHVFCSIIWGNAVYVFTS